MAKVYAMIADGTEEVECLAVVDVLRRAGIEVVLTSVNETKEVLTAHQIRITCDETVDAVTLSDADVIFLPGGVPGTPNLAACTKLTEALKRQAADGKRIAAICAAPSILGGLGLTAGKRATCYPGYEKTLAGAAPVHDGVVTDGNITTARGLGYALDLGLELVRLLISGEKSREIKAQIQYDQC